MGNQAGTMTPTTGAGADDYTRGRSPQRGRPTQVDTRGRENGVSGGGGVQATPRSGTASGRSLGSKKYRHYSADWVLKKNEMAPELQKNDPLLLAHMDDVNESDEANLYDSDIEYDSDFETTADKDKDLEYLADRVDIDTDRIDDHSRLTYNKPEAIPTSHLRGLADTMKKSRSRARLAR